MQTTGVAGPVRSTVATLVIAVATILGASGAFAEAGDPAILAGDLISADRTLHDAAGSDAALAQAARRQQVTYRSLGHDSATADAVRALIPEPMIQAYDRNIDARRQLTALTAPKDSLPPWRVIAPTPAGELLDYYHSTAKATGVGWTYLAAINMVETGFGRIAGTSEADAHGPMQFLPSTFARYGEGGDINSPRDAIMAAGRYLAASGFTSNPAQAVYQYNHSDHYVRAIRDYAEVMSADPEAFAAYYRWDIYYRTTVGDILLPVGYSSTSRIPAAEYLATHPQ